MKDGIHPTLYNVVYTDGDVEWKSRSTVKSGETRDVDGVTYYVHRLDLSAYTHPFYTGKQKFVDTAGRIQRFQEKFKWSGDAAQKKAAEKPAAGTKKPAAEE